MKKMMNHCKGRFYDFDMDQLLEENEDMDQIEVDIDTQRIMVTRNNDLLRARDNLNVKLSVASLSGMSKALKQQDTPQQGCYHVMIEDYKGMRHKIVVFESNFIIAEMLRTEIIQQNGSHYLFIFSALNYINGEKKKTYLILRKPVDFVDNLIMDTTHGLNRQDYSFKHLITASEEM